MKKKQANSESSLGVRGIDEGTLVWTTLNYDIYIEECEHYYENGGREKKYVVEVFDCRDKLPVGDGSFFFWWEVLEYIECWN